MIAYAMYKLWYFDQLRVKKEQGFCPTGTWPQMREGLVSPGSSIILVDTSDRISKEDGEMAFKRIEDWVREAPLLQKISIYGLPEKENQPPRKVGDTMCRPARGDEAKILYENPRYVDSLFRKFLDKLNTVFSELLNREPAPQSPIVETLYHLVEPESKLDSLVLVSDMLQHSSIASHYPSGNGDITEYCKKISNFSRVKSIHVFYIIRENSPQRPDWRTPYWGACFEGIETTTLN